MKGNRTDLPAASPHVCVVILSWNRPDHILACLASLRKQDYPSFEVVVVDNGSVDGSPALIRQRFPEVTLVENGRNLGFAGGSNVGITLALARGADYVLLLNDDTEVPPDLLRALVEVGESDPDIGILGPKIYYGNSRVIWSAGGLVDGRGWAQHLRVGESDDGLPEPVREVDYVTGCAVLVKRKVIERVGVLDERFFAYFEETEWCARARRVGFRVVYVPQACMWHKVAPMQHSCSRDYLYLMARNRLLYLKCSGARPWITLLAAAEVLRTAASWALRPRHGDRRACSSALVAGVLDFVLGRFGAPPARPKSDSGPNNVGKA